MFEGVDLMENSGRSGDPGIGLADLLRTHKLRDRFLRDFDVDVSKTQFICQVTDIETDIIVEL